MDRMIEAETYGMMPKAKIESCSSAPPVNMLNMPRKAPVCWFRYSFITL
jgi:hypothetical protein